MYTETLPSVKQEMIHHIMSHNKCLTEEYLSNLNLTALMAECHPNYRAYFANRMNQPNKTEK